jgi:hypothetical protein
MIKANSNRILGFLLVLSIYNFDVNVHAGSHKTLNTSNGTCPAENFSEFIQIFSDDENIQRAFTQSPLKKQELKDADPEPKPFVRTLRSHEIKFPIFPLQKERESESLEMRVTKMTSRNAHVILEKPDTDYSILYFFQKKRCWRLVRVEDWSL